MKPRVTIATAKDGQLEICVNEAGRDLLVKELLGLSTSWDLFHFGSEMELPVQTIPYREGDRIHYWGKFLFRPDDWDAEYFPHVLEPKLSE